MTLDFVLEIGIYLKAQSIGDQVLGFGALGLIFDAGYFRNSGSSDEG